MQRAVDVTKDNDKLKKGLGSHWPSGRLQSSKFQKSDMGDSVPDTGFQTRKAYTG